MFYIRFGTENESNSTHSSGVAGAAGASDVRYVRISHGYEALSCYYQIYENGRSLVCTCLGWHIA